MHIVSGSFFLIMGLFAALFHKPLSRFTVRFYSELFDRVYDKELYEVGFLIGGIVFAAIGLLKILGII